MRVRVIFKCSACDVKTDDPNDAHFDYVNHDPIK